MSRIAICTHHDSIIEFAREIYRLSHDIQNSEDTDIMHSCAAKIENLINEIEWAACDAKNSGEAMEARLYEYYYAIEALGFTRKREDIAGH